MKFSIAKSRMALILLWFGFLVVDLGILFYLYFDQWIEKNNFLLGMKQINASYAPYLGVITLFYWGSAKTEARREQAKPGMPFFLAVIGSLLWNGMILLFLLPPLFKSGVIEEAVENIQTIGESLAWLVSGSIGYYFANPTLTKPGEKKQ